LEVELTLSTALAAAILNDPASPLITRESLPSLREPLLKNVLSTFRIEAGGLMLASPDPQAAIAFTDEGDVTCTFALPPSSPVPLRIHALFLERASPDSFCWVRLWTDPDNPVAQKLLVRNQPAAAFPLSSSPGVSAHPPAESPPRTR